MIPTSSSLGIVVKDGTHLTCKMSNRSMLDFMMWLQKNRSGLMQDADGTLFNHTTFFNHAIIMARFTRKWKEHDKGNYSGCFHNFNRAGD